jgi:hypothetical protein
MDVTEEPEPRRSRGHKATWLMAALVLLGVGGGVAYKLLGQPGEPTVAAPVAEDPAPPAPPPEAPSPEASPGEKYIHEAELAMRELQFADAAIAAKQARDAAPEGSDIHTQALTLQDQAREGLKYQWAYDSFNAALGKNDVRSAVYAFEQLPKGSPFRERATEKYQAMRDAWLAPHVASAVAKASRNRCGDIDDVAGRVRYMFPESAGRIDELAEKCDARRDRRDRRKRARKNKKTPAPAPEPIDPKLLPNNVPKLMIRQRLKKYKKHMAACLIENPLEVTSSKKTVSVIATLRIEPGGKLSSLEISPRTDALSSCLWLELRQEEFPPAREATSMKFSVGKGRIKNVKGEKPPEPGAEGAAPEGEAKPGTTDGEPGEDKPDGKAKAKSGK